MSHKHWTGITLIGALGVAVLAIAPGATAAPAPAVRYVPPPRCLAEPQPMIMVESGGYSPSTQTYHTPGSTAVWNWFQSATESVTSSGRLPLMHSRVKSVGTYSFKLWSAGSYAYHSAVDPSQKGVIKVTMCNVPKTAHVGTSISLQVASAHRIGWVADIQVLRPGNSKWTWLRTDV